MKKAAVLAVSFMFALYAPLIGFAQDTDQQEAIGSGPSIEVQDEAPNEIQGDTEDSQDMEEGSTEPAMPYGRMAMMRGEDCNCDMCMKGGMGRGMGMGMGRGRMGMGMGRGRMGMGMGRGRMGMGMMGGMGMGMGWGGVQRICKTPGFFLAHDEDLDLSKEQVASLEKIHSAMRKDMIQKGADVKVLELELSDIVSKPDFNLNDALAKQKDVEEARLVLKSDMLKFSAQARDVLTPEQMNTLSELCRPAGHGMKGMRGCKDPEDCKKMMMRKKMQREMQ